jgi:ribonuclease D
VKWTLIASDAELDSVLATYRDAGAVAVDTEFMRRNTFFPQVALLQLCFDDHAFLVDPLALESLESLRALFRREEMVKVLHSASEDLEVFDTWLGCLPRPLFDTQRAAGLLNQGFGLGYRALVAAHCGVELDKGETRSDWLQRPLSESQCDYAAMDVAYLLPVYREQHRAASASGKLAWILEDGQVACDGVGAGSSSTHERIKSAWKLNRRQLAVLKALTDWRESEARQRDKPRSWILSDAACLDIAQGDVRDLDALSRVTEVPPGLVKRAGPVLLEAVERALALPESELPAALPAPLDGPLRKRLKSLKSRGRDVAAALDAAPEAILPARDYERLLRESLGQPLSEPPHWRGWRQDTVIAPLRRFLAETKP